MISPLCASGASAARLRGIYAIVNAEGDPLRLTRAILEGGVRIVQYRAKTGIVPSQAAALRELEGASAEESSSVTAFYNLGIAGRAMKRIGAVEFATGKNDAAAGDG